MSRGKYTCTYCGQDHVAGCVNLGCPVGFHNVRSMHPEDLSEELCKCPIETERQVNYELGQVVAAEALPDRLRELAGKAFVAENDAHAKVYRDAAKFFEAEAKQLREVWTKKHRPARVK